MCSCLCIASAALLLFSISDRSYTFLALTLFIQSIYYSPLANFSLSLYFSLSLILTVALLILPYILLLFHRIVSAYQIVRSYFLICLSSHRLTLCCKCPFSFIYWIYLAYFRNNLDQN